MAGFSDLVHGMIDLTNVVSDSLQATITHAAYSGQNRNGEATYATGTSRKALIERKQELRRTTTGQEKMSHTKLTILVQVTIDLRDKITLPDGSFYPILDVNSMLDSSGNPYMVEVWF